MGKRGINSILPSVAKYCIKPPKKRPSHNRAYMMRASPLAFGTFASAALRQTSIYARNVKTKLERGVRKVFCSF